MLPTPLIIIFAALAIQIILFIVFKKKKRKIVLLTMLPVLFVGVWLGLKEYNRTNIDLTKVKADVEISANELIKEYEASDTMADKKYLGKIIELNGYVKNVENDESGNYTIVLGESNSLSSVRCSMDTTYKDEAAKIVQGSSVLIRGACTGFKKNELLGENLGSDVELNRCVLIKQLIH